MQLARYLNKLFQKDGFLLIDANSNKYIIGTPKNNKPITVKILEVNYKGINVLESQALREGIKKFSDWPTIPQVYIKGEFVGGCDIVKEMYENGELQKIFELKGINFKKRTK